MAITPDAIARQWFKEVWDEGREEAIDRLADHLRGVLPSERPARWTRARWRANRQSGRVQRHHDLQGSQRTHRGRLELFRFPDDVSADWVGEEPAAAVSGSAEPNRTLTPDGSTCIA